MSTPDQNAHAGPQASSPATSLSGLKALLVEDTWIIAQSYAGLLEPLGVSIIGPAARIEEAEALVARTTVDVALVDMNIDGEMAFRLIDTLSQKDIPVVVVTGYDVADQLRGAVAAVLEKPIRAETLLRTLRGIAGRRTSAA